MNTIADYHDGTSSSSKQAELIFNDDGSIFLNCAGVSKSYVLDEVSFSSRLGNTPRVLKLPDDAVCHIQDNDLVDVFLKKNNQQAAASFIHSLEDRLIYVLIAVVFTILFSWSMIAYGVPYLSKQIAYNLPTEVASSLGKGTLDAMDKIFFSESKLNEETRERLLLRFEEMKSQIDASQNYKIIFRYGDKIGANAFALPSGIIVVTDELIGLSENDDEVVAVIAHELGHLVHRHSVRMVLQDSAIAVLVSTITGDTFSSSSLVVALPTILANSNYSREFEIEADDYAYKYLVDNNMSLVAFANLLERITEKEPEEGFENYLSSHPKTKDRLQRFR